MKINNSKNPNLIAVYKDAKGNNWYSHNNVMDISPARGISAARADRFASLKIDETNMKALLNAAIDGINKDQNLVQAVSILHEIKFRLEFLCEENSLLDLAAIYYFLEDEDPALPSEHHNKLKREIWKDDDACRSFFLHMSLGLTKAFGTTSEEDLLKFLMNSKIKEHAERIYRFMPQ